jgi:hypothetical protein
MRSTNPSKNKEGWRLPAFFVYFCEFEIGSTAYTELCSVACITLAGVEVHIGV